MIDSIKTRTPILALILFVFAVGYTFAANRVVVIPMGGDSQPSGMVANFDADSCPAGWEAFTRANGRFIRSTDHPQSVGLIGGDSEHTHKWATYYPDINEWWSYDQIESPVRVINWGDGIGNEGSGFYPFALGNTINENKSYYTTSAKNYPPFILLLACKKL